MDQVEIKHLGTVATRIGFGCCPLGEHGWGSVDRSEMIEAIHSALDCGINLFDVSDVYGLGRAEETLGTALAGKRNRAIIVSKFGVRVEPSRGTFYDTSPAWIRTTLDASLRRLRTETIDVYLMHYWDQVTPLDEVFGTLEAARKAGKIRTYGLSNANPGPVIDLISARNKSHLGAFTLQYNFLDREFEGVIERTVAQLGMTFLSWGSLAVGLMSGKFEGALELAQDDRRWRYRNFVGTRFEENRGHIRHASMIARSLGKSTTAIALRWILDRLPGSIALVGMKSRQHVADAISALGWSLPRETLCRLDELTRHRRRDTVPGLQFINSAAAD